MDIETQHCRCIGDAWKARCGFQDLSHALRANQKSRCKYWATPSLFARTAHSFAPHCLLRLRTQLAPLTPSLAHSALLTSLARSAALICSHFPSDVLSRLLARSAALTRLLAPHSLCAQLRSLVRSLTPHCSLYLRALLRSLVCSLTSLASYTALTCSLAHSAMLS